MQRNLCPPVIVICYPVLDIWRNLCPPVLVIWIPVYYIVSYMPTCIYYLVFYMDIIYLCYPVLDIRRNLCPSGLVIWNPIYYIVFDIYKYLC